MKGSTKTPRVTPAARIKEFAKEPLTVRNKKLFCSACSTPLATKKSVLKAHFAAKFHILGTKTLLADKKIQADIADVFKEVEVAREGVVCVTPEVKNFRLATLEILMGNGIALAKLDNKERGLKHALEMGGYQLPGRRGMSELIPVCQALQRKRVHRAITGEDVSVIFDGTTHVGEALCIVVRHVDADLNVIQLLIRFDYFFMPVLNLLLIRFALLEQSCDSQRLSRALVDELQTRYQVGRVLAFMRDRCSVNTKAIRNLRFLYEDALDIGCFSHTLDNVGKRIMIPTVRKFMNSWNGIFKNSIVANLRWKKLNGRVKKKYSSTRWWSWFECILQVVESWGDVCVYLTTNTDICEQSVQSCIEIADGGAMQETLMLELAATSDIGKPLVQATYLLEGDGPLVFRAFTVIETVSNHLKLLQFSSVNQYLRAQHGSHTAAAAAHQASQARACAQPAVEYFQSKFGEGGDLWGTLSAFKAARYCDPGKVVSLAPTLEMLKELKAFPFIDDDHIAGLAKELPAYLAQADGVCATCNVLQWWQLRKEVLPAWHHVVRLITFVSPSSAAAERVFSHFQQSFTDVQDALLEDAIETTLMIQYNNRGAAGRAFGQVVTSNSSTNDTVEQ